MARRPRVLLPDIPLHIIQRGNNRSACFYSDEDYIFYIDTLAMLAEFYGCKVHALCLMTNHVRLLLTPTCCAGAGLLMKGLGQRYVQYVNRTYQQKNSGLTPIFSRCEFEYEVYDGGWSVGTKYSFVRDGLFFSELLDDPEDRASSHVHKLHELMRLHTGGDWRKFVLVIDPSGKANTKFIYRRYWGQTTFFE